MDISDSQFWIALLQIIWIDILLSGDNAVVIALACRSLPARQKKLGIALGAGAAIALRVIFAVFIVYLLGVPFLKVIGAALLLWIAVKLIQPEEEQHGEGLGGSGTLWAAVRTIVVADAVMSLDNVIAIAAASHGSVVLLIMGLLISIPLILFGSAMILKVIERFPIVVTAGAALLGYIAGEVAITDPVLAPWVDSQAAWLHTIAPIAGAVLVVAVGHALARRTASRPHAAADKAEGDEVRETA